MTNTLKPTDYTQPMANPIVAMDVDSARPAKARIGKKRIDKRRQKKASIVFPKYSDKLKAKKKKTA